MKTRQGFVSNSSTSSFVVLGFTSKSEHYDYEDGIWLDGDECWLIGDVIAQGDECDFGADDPIEIGDLVQRSHKIAKEHDVELDRIKLHVGMRAC